MTSDINIIDAIVTAIQGNAVSTTTPTDGYVLTWNASGDGYWEPKSIQPTGLRKEYFTSSGTWTCPEGVTSILAIGSGGGGGGGGGSLNMMGSGGGAAIQQTQCVSVTPGVAYTITIGAGGNGGNAGTSMVNPTRGSDGNATSMTYSAVNYFYTIGGGGGGAFNGGFHSAWIAGPPFAGVSNTAWSSNGNETVTLLPGGGGYGSDVAPQGGLQNWLGGYSGGSVGGNTKGGSGGGAGPQGAGGSGGSGASGSNAGNGSSASPNTGAGGGGGGCGNGTGAGGSGGDGGSGYMVILF